MKQKSVNTKGITIEGSRTKKDDNILLPINQEIEKMMQYGVHFGHKRTHTHPSMKEFILTLRDGINIFNLEKTYYKLKDVLEFLKEYSKKEDKLILFLGTLPHFKPFVKEFAESLNMPYVNERWVGGLITNFENIKKSIERYKKMKEEKEAGLWDSMIKKERVKLERELKRLDKKWYTLRNMTRLPDILFVFNVRKNLNAIKEAKLKGIKVIAIADTDSNVEDIDFVIPANDNSISSVEYITSKIKKVLLQ